MWGAGDGALLVGGSKVAGEIAADSLETRFNISLLSS
jgi:hypothetical protein